MTLPVPNLKSAIGIVKNGFVYLVPPWNSFFQQLVQRAPAVIAANSNPYTANQNGTLILATATVVDLTRGTTTINLNGQKIIPISIGDTVSWNVGTAQFLGS